jgi:hypothetical protein
VPDAYSLFLGIPETLRPPTHYQLLGISPSELDRAVITGAAERQLRLLSASAVAPEDERRRIAAEVERARDVLLDPLARQRYDAIAPDAADPWWKPPAAPPAPAGADDWWKDGAPAPAAMPTPAAPAPPPPAANDWWKDGTPGATTLEQPAAAPLAGKTPAPTASPAAAAWWKGSAPDAATPPPVPMPAVAKAPTTPPPVRVTNPPAPPVESETPTPAGPAEELEDLPRARLRSERGSPLPWVALAAVLIAGGGAAAFFLTRKSEKPAESGKEVAQWPPAKEKEIPRPLMRKKEKAEPVAKVEPTPPVEPAPKKVVASLMVEPSDPSVTLPDPKTEPGPAPREKNPPEPKTPAVDDDLKTPATFRGHDEAVLGVAITPDAKWVVSVSSDKKVLLHDRAAGTHVLLHRLGSEGVAVVACGKDAVAFCDGGKAFVYDLAAMKVLQSYQNPRGGIECLAALPDGSAVLTGSTDGCVRVWGRDEERPERTYDVDEKSGVTALAVAPDGAAAFFGLADGRICAWDLKKGREVRRWKAHPGRVTALAAAPGGRLLSGHEDGTALVWPAAAGKPAQKLAGHKGPVLGVAWTSDGARALTGGIDKKVCLWDNAGRKAVWAPPVAGKVYCLAADAKDRFVLAGEVGGVVQLLPLPAGPTDPASP